MKKTIIVLLFFSAFIIRCSDDNGLDLPVKMTAKIDGTEWNAITRATVLNNDKFIITGTSLSGETLSITIVGISEGTYILSLTSAQCGAVYKETISASTDDAFASVSGEVVLENVNTSAKEISGTYSFSVRRNLTDEAISITEGVFSNLKYTETE